MPSLPASGAGAASCPIPRPSPHPLPHVGVSPPQSAHLVADGLACVACGVDYLSPAARSVRRVPVGRSATGSQVFACTTCCGEE